MLCHFLYKTIYYILPVRAWRRKFTAVYAQKVLQARFQNKIQKIRKYGTKQKIKVVFLANDPAKWQYQNLYDVMAQSEIFSPIVLITKPDIKTKDKNLISMRASEIYNFFKSKKMNVEYVFDTVKHKPINIKRFNPDIIFHKNPYGLGTEEDYIDTSLYALNCYIPYTLAENTSILRKEFINSMYKYFVINDDIKKEYEEFFSDKLPNMIPTGHPKADVIPEATNKDKYTIIYAPHHSFGSKGLMWATFEWNGKEILELAKKTPQFKWILKPHPQFEMRCKQFNIMPDVELEQYLEDWKKTGTICDSGDYFELFANSDLMITDCGSFLVEYLAFNKPVIHLINKHGQPFDSVMEKASSHYYKTTNLDELFNNFNMIAHNNNDYLAQERKKDMTSFNFSVASDNIINELKQNILK